jgi:hypothetical protein
VSALLIDSGVDSHADLLGLLPPAVAPHITERMLDDAGTAAALRLLAEVRQPEWHRHARHGLIDRDPIISWARNRELKLPNERRAALEIAASLDGYAHAHVNLAYAVKVMSHGSFMAVLDALRIATQGVSK